jgi:hypothetical protein
MQFVKYRAQGLCSAGSHSWRIPAFPGIVFSLIVAACGGGGGSGGNASAVGAVALALSFNASSSLVRRGELITLSWSAPDASSCTASDGWSGVKPSSGSERVGPITRDTTYTLSCSGADGGAIRQLTVRLDDGSGAWVELDATPPEVLRGGTSTLSWSATGATGCDAGGGWSGSQPPSGSFTVGPIQESTTYQLACEGPSGAGMAMVTVRVASKTLRWQPPTQNVDGSRIDDLGGYVIYWGTSSRAYTGSHRIESPDAREWVATVPPGWYYFAMTAFDAEGNESGYSNEIEKLIP